MSMTYFGRKPHVDEKYLLLNFAEPRRYLMISPKPDRGRRGDAAPVARGHGADAALNGLSPRRRTRRARHASDSMSGGLEEAGMALHGEAEPAGPWPRYSTLTRPSILLEHRAAFELAELFAHPAYYGVGVPRGDGAPVLLIPGFLGSDGYLTIMNAWLRRIGYRPQTSGLWLVVGSPFDLAQRVLRRMPQAAPADGRRLTIIGHSLGGVLARLIAQQRPDLVEHVITLGSPLCRDPRGAAHPLVGALADVLVPDGPTRSTRRTARGLEQRLVDLMLQPLPDGTRLSCLYSREDAVVDWRACIDSSPGARAYEVHGTHTGLAWNAGVYEIIGRLLPRILE